jgi:hypothetical protein
MVGSEGRCASELVLFIVREWLSSGWRGELVDRCCGSGFVFFVGVVVRVTVRDKRGRFIEVGIVGHRVMVCCNGTVDVDMEEVAMGIARDGAGVGLWWCRKCVERGRVVNVDDGGHALVTDIAFYLVVNVGVAARGWWVARAGCRGEVGVVAAVVRGGIVHLGRGSR